MHITEWPGDRSLAVCDASTLSPAPCKARPINCASHCSYFLILILGSLRILFETRFEGVSLSFPQDFWGDSGSKTAKLGTFPVSVGSLERAWHRVLGVGFASEMEEELCRWPFVSEQNTPIVYRLSLEDIQWLSKFHRIGEESWEGLSWFSGSPCPWTRPCPPLLP